MGLVGSIGCIQPDLDTFQPSVEGKKYLQFRGPSYDYMKNHTAEMEEIPYDGLIIGGELPFYQKVNVENLDAFAERMRKVPFKRYTDNFYLCYSATGERDKDFDWFHDFDWIVENWRAMAAAARKAGFKGICFDSEYYAGIPLFGYFRAKYKDAKTFEEYQDQVYSRGAEIMRAVNKEFPDITIICLFGYSGSFHGVPQHPKSSAKNYTLVSACIDGMLSECGPDARIYDQHEQSFSFRIPGSFARARTMTKDLVARYSRDPDKYRRNHRVGFSFWGDCWNDNTKGRPFDVKDFQNNYYTPEEFAYALHNALAYSDKYVWTWPGAFNWWQRTVKTLDENGKEVTVPCPPEYVEAMHRARLKHLPEPPRDRKPNTYRVLPAPTQEGWSDKATFTDLWDDYEFIADLPIWWRFAIDPDEVGTKRGWYGSAFDDGDWVDLRIREFWEPQGYSPYDGGAWYRVAWRVPRLPKDKRVYLAFGGVSEEASVYVSGQLLYESVYSENIRHKRFLVDVTDRLESGEIAQIAVRVWNTGWCGGIWKNVKLISANRDYSCSPAAPG